MLTTLSISFTEQHPFLPAYSQNYAVLNIVGIIIIINSIRIRAGVFLQRYRKHYCVTYSHNISCFVHVLGGFHMRVAVDAVVDVEN